MKIELINNNSICRACARTIQEKKNRPKMIFLFQDNQIVEMYQSCTTIQISASDNLPKFLCTNCHLKLIQYHKFRQICLESEKLHKLNLNKSLTPEIKDENDQYNEKHLPIFSSEMDSSGNTKAIADVNQAATIRNTTFAGGSNTNNTNNINTVLIKMPSNIKLEEDDSDDCGDGGGGGVGDHDGDDRDNFVDDVYFDGIDGGKNDNDIDENKEDLKLNILFDQTMNDDLFFNQLETKKRRIRKKKPKSLMCDICKKKFNYKHCLLAHLREKHLGLKPYACNKCDKHYSKGTTLRKHLKKAHRILIVQKERSQPTPEKQPQENFACEKCGKVFYKKHRIEGHLRQHLGLKPFRCIECKVEFRKYSTFQLHKKCKHSEGEVEMFHCEYPGCDKAYNLRGSLKKHQDRIHLGKARPPRKTLICDTCGRSFTTRFFLTEHQYTHLGPEHYPYACEICPKRFVAKYKLKVHIMRHNKIKNFECSQCGMRTTTAKEMRTHQAYHIKDVPYPCDMCTRIFASKVAIQRHIRVVHRGHKPYICSYCNLAFAKADTLKHHVMRHTGEKPHACTICDKRFIQLVALRTHIKTHNRLV